MTDPSSPSLTVAITGASGALGQALLRRWHRRGAQLIALTHGRAPLELSGPDGQPIPLRQVPWQVGEEAALEPLLEQVDVLVLNHGINVHGDGSAEATDASLQVNALSVWRLLELFALVAQRRQGARGEGRRRPEVWVNTSEAEIQPALSPLYEISKRLLGQLLSLRAPELAQALRLRRLVLGPFRSALNPIGVMGADWVAGEILRQADWNCSLIIVTPNPLTYVLMPLTTMGRWAYFGLLRRP
ncbi:MAG: NAD-dependent epimerase/dehydratase family protein [Cyanobium sp. CZS 25K]|nr:NAD-dependent epimerase/dehydratase family protein [Cyanobium sp. CZS25K]